MEQAHAGPDMWGALPYRNACFLSREKNCKIFGQVLRDMKFKVLTFTPSTQKAVCNINFSSLEVMFKSIPQQERKKHPSYENHGLNDQLSTELNSVNPGG